MTCRWCSNWYLGEWRNRRPSSSQGPPAAKSLRETFAPSLDVHFKVPGPRSRQIDRRKRRERKTNTRAQFGGKKWSNKWVGPTEKCKCKILSKYFQLHSIFSCTFLSIRIWMHGDIDNVSWTLSSNSIKLSNCAWANCERLRWRFPLHYCVELFTRFAYNVPKTAGSTHPPSQHS